MATEIIPFCTFDRHQLIDDVMAENLSHRLVLLKLVDCIAQGLRQALNSKPGVLTRVVMNEVFIEWLGRIQFLLNPVHCGPKRDCDCELGVGHRIRAA